MLEFIKETQNVWDMLKEKNLPIVMYGMGDGALKIINVLERYGLKVSEFFASDEFVRGHSFMGYKVRKLSEIEEMYEDFIIVMAFAIHDIPMTNRIHEIAKKHILVAPDVPVAGDNLFTLDFVDKNKEKLQWVYENLEDEQSKKVFSDIVNFKISGKISYLTSCETEIEESYKNILKLNQNEVYADLGAYHGETIDEFLQYTGGKYERIIAFEPDVKNFKKLKTNIQNKNINADLFNMAIFDKEDKLYFSGKAGRNSALSKNGDREVLAQSLDNIAKGNKVSFVNIDVEGYERQALLGMKNTIEKYKTRILVAIYHRSEDIFEIPILAKKLNPDYKFYMRHFRYIPAWDTNLYCI